jgi:branched-chain amino acid transport system substrate-binding protein
VKAKAIGAVVCAVVAAAGVSACGSSSTPGGSPAAGSAAPSGGASASIERTTSGPAFQLGFICSCSGPEAAVLADSQKVATAWADHVNSTGGINGHPVKLYVEDDNSSAATALQDAKTLVQQDHVMAVVGEISLQDASFVPYLASQGIPVVGGASPEAVQGTSADVFPSGSPLLPLIIGTLAEAKGKRNLGAMYCAEDPICAQLIPLAKGVAPLFGLKVTPQSISSTAPSYAAPCLALRSAGVDALYVADNGPIVQRVVAGCAQQGYSPTNIGQASTLTNTLMQDPHMQGTLVAGTNANPYDSSLPAVQEFQSALEKYDPGLLKGSTFAYDAFYPWTGGMLFQAAAKAGSLTPASTPAALKKALYSLKADTLGGLAPPLTYTPGKPFFTPCWFTGQISGSTLASTNSDKPVCLPAAQTAAVVKALHLG